MPLTIVEPGVGGTGTTAATGTGSAVLSNSPTLVTPTLGSATATQLTTGLGTAGAPALTFTGDTNTGIFSPGADTIAFAEGGTESMRIDSSGNVGIGTSSSVNGLSIYRYGTQWTGNTGNTYPVPAGNVFLQTQTVGGADNWFGTTGTYGATTGSSNLLLQANLNNTSQQAGNYIGSEATGSGLAALTFGRMIGGATTGANATKSEAMRITSAGELLIGRTASSSALLGITSSSGNTSINCGDAVDTSSYGILQIVRPGDQPDNKFHISIIRNGFQVAGLGFLDNSSTFAIQNSFNTSGAGVTLGVNATSWGTTSDERKKDVVGNVENALTKLADWRSVYYKYKIDEADTPQRVGLIAQDVQATLPEAISAEEDELQTLQLRYTEVIPVLVKAIQELNAKVEAQAAEIAALKAQE